MLLINIRKICSCQSLFINPEIRINVFEHALGNKIANVIYNEKYDSLNWLDNHDFSIRFPFEKYSQNNFIITDFIFDNAQKALNSKEKSRFKIRISISGTYGMQQYAQVKNYNAEDIVIGKGFKPIDYNDKEDKRYIRNIRFKKHGNFWKKFERIKRPK